MRILIIRHADPDYVHDSLTPKGFREAELLTQRLLNEKIDAVYLSPLGRARKTAEPYLKMTGKNSKVYPWLREFYPKVVKPRSPDPVCWDLYPDCWENIQGSYDLEHWGDLPLYQEGRVKEAYDEVIASFDLLLKEHGYEREGMHYHATKPNHDTIAFFCHFGIEAVLLSRLMNCSPMIIWHHMVALPSSVTELVTEERDEGIAIFRMNQFGSLDHLYQKEEPSFSARFCECYQDDTRHV